MWGSEDRFYFEFYFKSRLAEIFASNFSYLYFEIAAGSEFCVPLAGVRAGTVDAGTSLQDTVRDRNQLARSWMTTPIRSRERHQRRAAHT